MFPRVSLTLPAAFLALVALAGCSKSGSHATVSGVVTHNGSPVEGAKVVFHSTAEVDGKAGQTYGALTDSSGKYVIARAGKEPGMAPGLYKVTVVKFEGGKGFPEGLDQGQIDAMVSATGGTSTLAVVNLLPKEYAALGTSKLSATLEPGPNKGVNFDLKGK